MANVSIRDLDDALREKLRVRAARNIERLPAGKRKERLRSAAVEVFVEFGSVVLAFDEAAAQKYAQVIARGQASGHTISGFDAQIASICLVHGATLVTRNVKDFGGTAVDLINPWDVGARARGARFPS